MRQDYVVEILPDGRAALRLVIVPDDAPPPADHANVPDHEPERGVVIIPAVDDDPNVITWQM